MFYLSKPMKDNLFKNLVTSWLPSTANTLLSILPMMQFSISYKKQEDETFSIEQGWGNTMPDLSDIAPFH